MKYNHITIEERETIQEMLWEKKSMRDIAKELGRSPSSISRELARNTTPVRKRYSPRIAQQRARKKTKSRGREQRLKNQEIREYVEEKLRLRWPPEQISGRIKIDLLDQSISHETIYQYIYHKSVRYSDHSIKEGYEDLRKYLRRKKRSRSPKQARNPRKVRFEGTSIEERPKVVLHRSRIGDWETDSVESSIHKPGVNTLLERKSGLYLVQKLKNKTSKATTEAIVSQLQHYPCHTLTLDNGSENAQWRTIVEQLNISTYYCHPYCSGERRSNENANGLLRDYFPKKTDFTTIPQTVIDQVVHQINSRPRKRHNWKTPLEVFNESVALGG